ncbi:disease resistance protein UNI-like [Mangifera indica]|uniref:disease resistance protein UNI-like n=1 Tax=Mangifera indica TaxID=29780 RepID=UPI001CFB6E2D|nr:disease resistance protein UNI-like [Mangifera indica]
MEICTSFVGSISEIIFTRLFDASGRQIGYLLKYNDNIETLQKQAQKLKATRHSMQLRIDAAARNREIILPDVQSWISEVDNVSAEAEEFLEDERNVNKMCFKGWCIDVRSRYRFSKAAKRKITVITQLQEGGTFQAISQPALPPSSIIVPTVGFSGIFESRESIKNEIMEALKDDKVSIIGICGMGGVGKTTLVKQVGKQAEEEKLYDSVVFVVVSQTPNIMEIQKVIAHKLGLESLLDCPESERASSLWQRIKEEKRILIILDDVWGRIKFEEIGIPFGKDHRGCKIMLTSRSKDVCDEMDCNKISIVGTLSKQESWELFKEVVGMDVENSVMSPIAREVVAECDGLPIAIVTIARALKNKNEHVWIDVARQLKTSTPTDIPGMKGSVISSLELSIKYLEIEDAKSLFFFCSVFPEDFEIPIEVLVTYGVALRWFKNVETMKDVRHRVHAIVSTLTSSFLLIYGKHRYTMEECVKLHDVVRDVACIIAPKYNQIFLVKAGTGLKEWPNRDTYEDLTCISLMSNDIKEVPGVMECPKLLSLLLQGNSKMVFPNNFFQGMKDLRVVDLSKTQLLPLPESLSLLANLRTLYLNSCELGDLSIIGHLSKLEILSLNNSNVREIPISFSQLIHLRLLALNYCENLAQMARGVISSLCKLEELYVLKSFEHWDSEGDEGGLRSNAKLAELQSLSRLTSLQIAIPNLDFLIDSDVPFKNLSNFAIIIGGVRHLEKRNFMISSKKYSRKLLMSNDDKVMIPGLINCLKNLVIEQTESLSVAMCKSVVYIFDCGVLKVTYGKTKLLSPLKVLHLTYLPSMTHIWKGETQYINLCNLKIITLWECPQLVKLFSQDLLQSLFCLEEMMISSCNNLEEIFIMKEEEEIIPPRKDLTTTSSSLGNLTSIEIGSCHKLKSLFTPTIVKNLVKLSSLIIRACSTLEEIVTTEKVSSSLVEKIVFPSLSKLELLWLRNIGCFSSSSYSIEFPVLETLVIIECPNMKIFGYGEQLTPKLNKVVKNLISFDKERWMGNLNSTIEQLFIEEQIFGYGEQLTPKLNKVVTDLVFGEGRWMGNLNSIAEQLFIKEQEKIARERQLVGHCNVWLVNSYTDEVLVELGQKVSMSLLAFPVSFVRLTWSTGSWLLNPTFKTGDVYPPSTAYLSSSRISNEDVHDFSETHAVADELEAARNGSK